MSPFNNLTALPCCTGQSVAVQTVMETVAQFSRKGVNCTNDIIIYGKKKRALNCPETCQKEMECLGSEPDLWCRHH